MTNSQADFILRVLLNNKVYGYPNKVAANYIEGDKRKQGKALRELVEAGYLTQTGKEFSATNKLWDELPTEGFDLIAQWEKDRKDGWNKRKQFDFVRFQSLTDGQKKLVVECAGHYDWYICHHTPIAYDHKIEDGDLQGPINIPDSKLGEKVAFLRGIGMQVLAAQKRGGWNPEFEVVLKKASLTAHVNKVLAEEKFAALYQQNLKWGLSQLDVVSSEDAKEIITSDEPDWLFGGQGNSNLGADPVLWGDKLTEKIANSKDAITRLTKRLAIMESIAQGVEEMGGWEVFREKYKAKLTEELAKKSE